jgi:hypothetical protein
MILCPAVCAENGPIGLPREQTASGPNVHNKMLARVPDDLDKSQFKVDPAAARSLPSDVTFEPWNSRSMR